MGLDGTAGGIGGAGVEQNPLLRHLKELEQAMWSYLEHDFYESAPLQTQMKLRQKALVPTGQPEEMPEPYRLWLRCKRMGKLPLSGGILEQPAIMMLEFDVVETVIEGFKDERQRMLGLLKE